MQTEELIKNVKTERLYWEKYRPTSLKEIILPDRITSIVKHGIQTNLLFVGPAGIGKTTLSKILIQDHPYIIKSAKLGVDVLRSDVLDFCQSIAADPFAKNNKERNVKVVYLEEFDGATKQLQEELRAFIEQYEKNVRFIATANNLNKIIPAMQSRFTIIDFTPKNQDEVKNLKMEFAKRLVEIIEKDKLNVTREQVKDIIRNNFPDLRKCMSVLQITNMTGSTVVEEHSDEDIGIYELISQQTSPQETWNYLYTNWLDRLDLAFSMFDKKYWDYVMLNKPQEIPKMPNRMIKVSQYVDVHLNNARDPFVTLCAMIFELQKI